jgi:hypothetical protein
MDSIKICFLFFFRLSNLGMRVFQQLLKSGLSIEIFGATLEEACLKKGRIFFS